MKFKNMKISDISPEPLQHQIIRQIRALILSGSFRDGDPLPSIRVSAGELGVSVITVQRAYESLEREGLIHARRSKGYFVSRIRRDSRKNIAFRKLSENAEPAIKNALRNGLSPPEVKKTLTDIVDRS
jgi:GntR family transcriptional regulator